HKMSKYPNSQHSTSKMPPKDSARLSGVAWRITSGQKRRDNFHRSLLIILLWSQGLFFSVLSSFSMVPCCQWLIAHPQHEIISPRCLRACILSRVGKVKRGAYW